MRFNREKYNHVRDDAEHDDDGRTNCVLEFPRSGR